MQALSGNCTLGIGVVAPPVQLAPEAFHSPNSARALCSIRRRDYARCFTCKSCKIVQAHPFFPNRNRGYARLLACKSCKLVQACRFSRDGKRGMPASLHAGLANLCRCTPFLPKRGQGVRPFIYMPVLQIGAGIPLVSSREK